MCGIRQVWQVWDSSLGKCGIGETMNLGDRDVCSFRIGVIRNPKALGQSWLSKARVQSGVTWRTAAHLIFYGSKKYVDVFSVRPSRPPLGT